MMSLRGTSVTKQSLSIGLLLIFWLVGLFLSSGLLRPLRQTQVARNDIPFVLEPLTIQEKMLLGIKIPLDSLTQQEWETLPGIGPSTAQKIIAYQKRHGPVQTLAELDHVKGIGPKTIQAIQPFVKVSKF